MKKTFFLYCSIFFFILGSLSAYSQEITSDTSQITDINEEEAPLMFKFEPDFLIKNEERKAEITRAKQIIDTMSLTDRKRHKLLRDLYKNGWSKRLQKALLVTADFEDIEN